MPIPYQLARLVWVAWIVLASTVLSAPALAEKRVALVIGNGAYRSVPTLTNPINDAADVSRALERLGFTVQRVSDATYDGMRRSLRDFNQQANGADIAIVYFAGHGIEVGGENWLIPVDAELKSDRDVDIESIGLRSFMPAIESASRLGLIILDACRNNPFLNKMTRSVRTRSVTRGLASIEPTGNVLVAYAARDGTTASDGSGRNSPFTTSLLNHIETPGLEINFLFRNVRDDVLKTTRREQQPFVYGSLSRDAIYLKAALPTVAAPAPTPPDEVTWTFLKDTSDPAALKRFVEQFPSSARRAEADARITALARQQVEAARALEQRMASLAAEAKAAQDAAASRPAGPAPEDVAWGLVRDSKDHNQFRLFLDQFPKTSRRNEAEQRMAAIATEQRTAQAALDQRLAAAAAEQKAATAALEQRLAALAAESQAVKARPAGPAPEDVAWGLVKDSKDPNQFRLFLDQFPKSARRGEATQRMTEITAEQRAAAASLEQRMAALTKEKDLATPAAPALDKAEATRLLQYELKRVGCFDGAVNGEFNKPTQSALRNFAKLASVSVPDELSTDTLKAIREFDKRICPLACKAGQRAEGERCVAIAKPETEKRAAAPRKPGAAAPSGGKGGKCFAFSGRTFCE